MVWWTGAVPMQVCDCWWFGGQVQCLCRCVTADGLVDRCSAYTGVWLLMVWWTGAVPMLGSLHVVTQSDSLTQYEKTRKEQQLTSASQQVIYPTCLPVSSLCPSSVLLLTHTHTQPFNSPLSGTTRIGRYKKKHSPTHTHPGYQNPLSTFIYYDL